MCLAAPARVISIADRQAVVDYNGVRTTARLDTLTEPLAPGDYVLIHTGFAIRRLSPEDGEMTLRLFDELANSLDVNNVSSGEAYLDRLADLSTNENAVRSRGGEEETNSLEVNNASSGENAMHPRPDDERNPSSGSSVS
jgi:hydrogenase expression/formation protein HypC